MHVKTGHRWTLRKTPLVQRRERRLQKRTVECTEQDEAKGILAIHCIRLHLWTSLLDLVLPLGIDGFGRESKVDAVQLFLSLNQVIVQVISHPSPFH